MGVRAVALATAWAAQAKMRRANCDEGPPLPQRLERKPDGSFLYPRARGLGEGPTANSILLGATPKTNDERNKDRSEVVFKHSQQPKKER